MSKKNILWGKYPEQMAKHVANRKALALGTNAHKELLKSGPTESGKALKDAVKQAEYDQCHECGERNFERFVNKVNVTSGYYFKAGVLKERPPRDNKGTHGGTSKLRCSNCKTTYNQKERKEGI